MEFILSSSFCAFGIFSLVLCWMSTGLHLGASVVGCLSLLFSFMDSYHQRCQCGLKSGGRGSGSKKFRFLLANFVKISIFSGNLKKSIFQTKICHLQLLLGKLFSSKVTTIEHTSCTW